MIHLILEACLATSPYYCNAYDIRLQDRAPMAACDYVAEPAVVAWQQHNRLWIVKEWTCVAKINS